MNIVFLCHSYWSITKAGLNSRSASCTIVEFVFSLLDFVQMSTLLGSTSEFPPNFFWAPLMYYPHSSMFCVPTFPSTIFCLRDPSFFQGTLPFLRFQMVLIPFLPGLRDGLRNQIWLLSAPYPFGHGYWFSNGHVSSFGPESSVLIYCKHRWEKQSFYYKRGEYKPQAAGVHITLLGEGLPERSREIQSPL